MILSRGVRSDAVRSECRPIRETTQGARKRKAPENVRREET
ncbi:hypothetical protein T261_0559 [Streptomyces lydicus]|nr:hypothetical protein T261_0559 [Streptomyces lydicus]